MPAAPILSSGLNRPVCETNFISIYMAQVSAATSLGLPFLKAFSMALKILVGSGRAVRMGPSALLSISPKWTVPHWSSTELIRIKLICECPFPFQCFRCLIPPLNFVFRASLFKSFYLMQFKIGNRAPDLEKVLDPFGCWQYVQRTYSMCGISLVESLNHSRWTPIGVPRTCCPHWITAHNI